MQHSINLTFTQLLAAICCLMLLAGCSPEKKKNSHLQKADTYLSNGEFETAEIEYMNVLQLELSNVSALNGLSSIYFNQGRFNRAFPVLLEILKTDPENLEARRRIATIYFAGGRVEEALNEIDYILERDPQDTETIILLADIPRSQSSADSTKTRLQGMSQDNPAVQVALGMLQFKEEKYENAADRFKNALEIDPNFPTAYIAYGNLHFIREEFEEAKKSFQKAIELAPENLQYRLRYAQFLIATKSENAVEHINETFENIQAYLPAKLLLAQIAFSEKRYDDSKKLLDEIIRLDPSNLKSHITIGQIHQVKGEYDQAIAVYEKLLKAYPNQPLVHYQLALSHISKNEFTKAISDLEEVTRLYPNHPEASMLLAGLNARTGSPEDSVLILKQLVESNPELVSAQLALAQLYSQQRKLEDAYDIYETLGEKFPENKQLFIHKGTNLLLQNNVVEARQRFEAALAIDPNAAVAIEQLNRIDIFEKKFEQAEARIAPYLAEQPDAPLFHLLKAHLLFAKGQPEQGVESLLKTIELDPKNRNARILLSRYYLQKQDRKSAMAILKETIVQYSQDTESMLMLGLAHEQEGDYDNAKATYEKILEVDPKHGPGLNNLAILHSQRFNELDKALELAQQARVAMPYDPYTADTLGWLYFQSGDYRQAIPLISESSERLNENPEVQYHLGITHYMLGNETKAKVALNEALNADSEFLGVEDAREALRILNSSESDLDSIALLEKRIANYPSDSIALTRLAVISGKNGDSSETIKFFEKAIDANPQNSDTIALFARHLYDSGEMARGFEIAKSGYKLSPNDANMIHTLGLLAFENKEFSWALSLLQEAARALSERSGIQYDLARIAYANGRIALAKSSLELAISQGSTEELSQFKEMLELGENPQLAAENLNTIESALQNNPTLLPAKIAKAAAMEIESPDSLSSTYREIIQSYPEFTPAKRKLILVNAKNPAEDQNSAAYISETLQTYPNDKDLKAAISYIEFRRENYSRTLSLLSDQTEPNAESLFYLGMSQYELKRDGSLTNLEKAIAIGLPEELKETAQKAIDALSGD